MGRGTGTGTAGSGAEEAALATAHQALCSGNTPATPNAVENILRAFLVAASRERAGLDGNVGPAAHSSSAMPANNASPPTYEIHETITLLQSSEPNDAEAAKRSAIELIKSQADEIAKLRRQLHSANTGEYDD